MLKLILELQAEIIVSWAGASRYLNEVIKLGGTATDLSPHVTHGKGLFFYTLSSRYQIKIKPRDIKIGTIQKNLLQNMEIIIKIKNTGIKLLI